MLNHQKNYKIHSIYFCSIQIFQEEKNKQNRYQIVILKILIEKYYVSFQDQILPFVLLNKNKMQNQKQVEVDLQLHQNLPIFRRKSENKGKCLDQLVERIRKNSEDASKSETTMLIVRRRKQQNEQRKAYYKDIYQESMKPGFAVLRTFSQSRPLCINDPFLDQKKKAKLLFSQRAYTKMPNIVSGNFQPRAQTQSQLQKEDWISRKYSQFDRTVTQQTGPMRIFMKKRKQIEEGYEKKKPIYTSKLKNTANLFSNFEVSKNDFYDAAKQTVSTNVFSMSLKTQASLQDSMSSKVLLKQKFKKIKSQAKESLKDGWRKRIHTDFE